MKLFNSLSNLLNNSESCIVIRNNSLYIINYKKISSMNEKELIVQFENKICKIQGQGLVISNLSKSELLISGEILEVKYE